MSKLKDFFKNNKGRIYKYFTKGLWVLIIAGIVSGFVLFFYLSKQDLPTFSELENPEYDLASIIYDNDNVAFGKYYVENREPLKFEEISPKIVNALIATEDERFYSHSGIDLQALVRVAFKSLLLRKESSGGGSTISQQLAKLLFDRPSLRGMGSLKRAFKLAEVKFKEWITAVKLEKSYTKEEIIAMYLNKFEFINGAHGIQAAAQTYFNKDQAILDVEEAAVLVGMLKNPSLYNPLRFPDKSRDRRNVVLTQMRKKDLLDKRQFDTLTSKAIDMSGFNRKNQSEGPAPYFRAELTKWLRDLFEKENIRKADGSLYNIYTDGLKIHTTIDLEYQILAEEAVIEHMKDNQDRYWRVWKNRNPWTYDSDEVQRGIRADILERRIKASDRYLEMRTAVMGAITADIRKKYPDLPLSDNVIKALIAIKNKKSYFAQEESRRRLESDYKKAYERLMSDESMWLKLISQWDALQERYQKEFNTPVPMKVFDYNEEGFRLDTMTPLDSVKYHNQILQSGLLAVHPETGYIKAWVGGVNHQFFKYDHVNSRRQVGSTIKPFVYSTAIGVQGISPCQEFDDIQYTIVPGEANFYVDKEWSPANANGEFTGNKYNLFHGLLYSKNSITVRLIKEMGNVEVVRGLLRNVGIDVDYEVAEGKVAVPNVPSISLGAVDISLYDMAGAYTTFANNGMYTQPIFIKNITDKNGKVIYTGIPQKNLAINPTYNAVMIEMLRNNVGGRYGLGVKTPVGGKTGTTNDYADGWFMAITPELVVGTWVGGDDKWIRFLSLENGQGYVMARPIVQKFLKKLEENPDSGFNPEAEFKRPSSGYGYLIDCERYKQILPEDEQAEIQQQKKKKEVFDEEFDEEF